MSDLQDLIDAGYTEEEAKEILENANAVSLNADDSDFLESLAVFDPETEFAQSDDAEGVVTVEMRKHNNR